jgi:integrating conjugative element protein (TIGR03752 family)
MGIHHHKMNRMLYLVGISLLLNGCSNATPTVKKPTQAEIMQDAATRDTPLETLKTLTAEISAVEQQNQTLIAQNKVLNEQDKKTLAQFKTDLLDDVQKQMNEFKKSHEAQAEKTKAAEQSHETKPHHNGMSDDTVPTTPDPLTWVNDLQAGSMPIDKEDVPKNLLDLNLHAKSSELALTGLDAEKNSHAIQAPKKTLPYYTIPVNATLTGAVAMQPIMGRIPIEGKVTDPYAFKVIIGPKNLAANGVDIPEDIQGIVASGVAEGDMLGSCARGEITSMTFVFHDGRISTTQGKHDAPLGIIAAANGNPCILGEFHSNAALYLGAQATLSGLQGYGNALSQAQLGHTLNADKSSAFSTLIGSANQYALGQGFSSSAQAAAKWWEQRVQNSFDFIYVPHIDPRTHKPLQLNINITQEIPIDYDPNGRKVAYAQGINANSLAGLD